MRNFHRIAVLSFAAFLASACTDKGAVDRMECLDMKVAASCYTWAKKIEDGDRKQAIEIYDKACRMDHTEGCVRIGDLLVGEDPRTAHTWYKKACEANHPTGCVKQAETLLKLRAR